MVFSFLKSRYQKLKTALAQTSARLGAKVRALFQGSLDDETFEQLEKLLYETDLGVQAAAELTEKLRVFHRQNPDLKGETLVDEIRKELELLLPPQSPLHAPFPKGEGPLVLMVVGVNGNGKTTSVAKLAKRYVSEGQSVLLAAADTFRAAAIEQLSLWAERLHVDIVKGKPNSDPAAVVFDAITAAKARGIDVVIIDTAGRLHTKTHLMQELEKIRRSCRKFSLHSPQETLLVLDATTGQNAIEQARIFHQYTPLTGLILTKLDGTAKGGVVVAIQKQLGIPVKLIGVGEGEDDLEPFEPTSFVKALFES
jgi:fused signal recognition particle receptor